MLWGPEPEGPDRMAWVIRRGRTLTRVSVPIAVVARADPVNRNETTTPAAARSPPTP